MTPSRQDRKTDRAGEDPIAVALFFTLIAGLLYWGWSHRTDPNLRPEHGLGYDLGIAGAVSMLALLLYPLRKRMQFMRNWGSAAGWFRWHMALGILGPVLIGLHSGFQLESTNSAVAFLSMLIVAGSGVAGRYFYGQIHRGLYGERLRAKELLADVSALHAMISERIGDAGSWEDHIHRFESNALKPAQSFWQALWRSLSVGAWEDRCRSELLRELARSQRRAAEAGASSSWGRDQKRMTRRVINRYFTSVRKAANLALYERLFALWHILHVPLFILLVITALIHIVAVHLY